MAAKTTKKDPKKGKGKNKPYKNGKAKKGAFSQGKKESPAVCTATTQECPYKSALKKKTKKKQKKKPTLVKVEWLNDKNAEDDEPLLEDNADQYVNLRRKKEHPDPAFCKINDRLSHHPRFWVKITPPEEHDFVYRLVRKVADKGEDYSDDEWGSWWQFWNGNEHFRFSPCDSSTRKNKISRSKWTDATTDDDGTKVLDEVSLGAAAGDEYYVEAKLKEDGDGSAKKSKTLTVKPVVYYYLLEMQDVKAVADHGEVEDKYTRHNIQLCIVGGGVAPLYRNLGSTATAFKNAIRGPFQVLPEKALEPHILVIAYVHYIAEKRECVLRKKVGKPLPSPLEILVKLPGDKTKEYLWRKIDSDADEDWFISAEYQYHPENDLGETKSQIIKKDELEPVGFSKVEVKAKLPPGPGTIKLKVRVADFKNGRSYPNNLIVIATRVRDKTRLQPELTQTVIHEIGHKFGFVPDGTTLDEGCYHYERHGHRGNHCSFPHKLTEKQKDDEAFSCKELNGTCVMFGQSNPARKKEFCDDCSKRLRRQDLCDGWPLF
jgi:hypothetical protein